METKASSGNLRLLSLVFSFGLLIPVMLSNHRSGSAIGILLLLFFFFFPGYLLSTLLRVPKGGTRILLSFIVGICFITTAYSFFAGATATFSFFVLGVSFLGILVFLLQLRRHSLEAIWKTEDFESVLAGAFVAFSIAPLYWRSGRFAGDNFIFYGPAGQDPLFHVTLLQRLLHHVPADNFIVSGLRAPVYHYFDDLTLAFTLNAQKAFHLGSTDIFDLYYRCYPTIVYFLLGALAYRVGRGLLGKVSGGVLAVLLLLGGGGLGCIPGLLQTLAHVAHPSAMRSFLFSEWTNWNGADGILPLVHRPAHYHSLLICLAVLNLLLRPDRTRRDWIISGLLLGLMAGFNFTLAATFGIATVVAAALVWKRHTLADARDLACLAIFTLLGSLPVTVTMLLSGFHNETRGFPFRGPNLEFTTEIWGWLLPHFLPGILVPIAALILFSIMGYGVRLAGLRSLVHFQMGAPANRALACVLAVTFVLSFVVGTFFPFKALGGIAAVFIQPTLWILALFSLIPVSTWLHRNKNNRWRVALWALLAVPWIQSVAAFNLGHEAIFSKEAINLFQEIQASAHPDDVVAFLPTGLVQRPLWGRTTETTNFSVTALTGLDGYFSSESYTTSLAIAGLQGKSERQVLADAKQLYEQRTGNVESFLEGDTNPLARLQQDHVRWIVIGGAAIPNGLSSPIPWRKTPDFIVYRLP